MGNWRINKVIFAKPHCRLDPAALAKIKSELMRIASNGTRAGFKFVQSMFARYPELKSA
jgi:hypothetical protein